MYLTMDESCALAEPAANRLSKIRYSVPPFGIDVFMLEGLLLAEAEFDSSAAADALRLPPFISGQVSADDRSEHLRRMMG
jgi:CYTH domain-containing protein